jgi:Mor family transcriptional regulator
MRCNCCGGPFHPATGDYDKKYDRATCGACYRPFVKWVKGMMSRRWGGQNFYAAAATSIKAK